MIALNVETIDDEFEDNEIRRSGKSFSRDYEMLTVEICFLGKGSHKETFVKFLWAAWIDSMKFIKTKTSGSIRAHII